MDGGLASNKIASLRSTMLKNGLSLQGTTLEDVFLKDIKHPLWSAKLVDNEEDVIVAAHLAFLQAGSQAILTSTSVEL